MFYSHEVLTSRKHGVATVWLVATLGSKSTLRKVNKKAILAVDVTKTCETIIEPDAPMALRLQSSLLYGVSRVFNEQCSYVLADAQNAQNSIRALLRVVRSAQLDSEANRTRPDQLLLPDDPAFYPRLSLTPFDLGLKNGPFGNLESSQVVPSLSSTAQQVNPDAGLLDPLAPLQIPSSDSPGGGHFDAFTLQREFGTGSRGYNTSIMGLLRDDNDDGFILDPDFEFDADGNLLDFTEAGAGIPSVSQAPTPHVPSGPSVPPTSISVHPEQAHAVARLDLHDDSMDIDVPPLLEDDPFSSHIQGHHRSTSSAHPSTPSDLDFTAPAKRRKGPIPKIIPLDTVTELRNSEILRWNNEYLENMRTATLLRASNQVRAMARRRAEYYVSGVGLCDVGKPLANGLTGPISNPLLNMFAGTKLLQALGIIRSSVKRTRASDDVDGDRISDYGSETDARRGHKRLELEQPRGLLEDDVMEDFIPYHDNQMDEMDLEVGRDAPTPMDDISSAMPWNVSASIRGSSFIRRGPALGNVFGATGTSSITGGGVGMELAPRRGRTVSASPLFGRGLSRSALQDEGLGSKDEIDDGFRLEYGGQDDNFSQIDQVEIVDPTRYATPTVDDRINPKQPFEQKHGAAVLDQQAENFLQFIQQASLPPLPINVEEEGSKEHGIGAEAGTRAVHFEELLPPSQHSRAVACQAFLHALTLATKGLLIVSQNEAFGDITLQIVNDMT